MLYHPPVKRLQIMIDEDLDEALERQAQAEGASKAALIRRFVRSNVTFPPVLEDDPLGRWAGGDAFDPEPVDDVVYR